MGIARDAIVMSWPHRKCNKAYGKRDAQPTPMQITSLRRGFLYAKSKKFLTFLLKDEIICKDEILR